VRIARIFNTYGPRMCLDDGHVVSNFVAQVCLLHMHVSSHMIILEGTTKTTNDSLW
jgi:nucleoside-diphosphate-sugar epimerase